RRAQIRTTAGGPPSPSLYAPGPGERRRGWHARLRDGHGEGSFMGDGVSWPAGADEGIKGDLTGAAAYLTPPGGAVGTGVAPCGIGDRDRGVLGYTTSLGFGKKLERIVAEPQVALAYHTREHGFSASPAFVLAQGTAVVDLTPSRQRLEALIPQVERYM